MSEEDRPAGGWPAVREAREHVYAASLALENVGRSARGRLHPFRDPQFNDARRSLEAALVKLDAVVGGPRRLPDASPHPRTFVCQSCRVEVTVVVPTDELDRCLTCRFLDETGVQGRERERILAVVHRGVPRVHAGATVVHAQASAAAEDLDAGTFTLGGGGELEPLDPVAPPRDHSRTFFTEPPDEP